MEFENKAKDAEKRGDFLSAIKFYLKALESIENMQLIDGFQFDAGNILQRVGNLYTEIGEFKTAIKYYEEAINAFLESDEPLTKVYRLAGESHTNIGVCHITKSKFDTALRHFKKAVDYTKKATDLEDQILRKYVVERVLFNLALIILCLINLGKIKKDIKPFIDTASMLNKSYNVTGFAPNLILFLRHILTEKYSEARMLLKDELEEASGSMLLTSTLQGTIMGLIQDLTAKHIPKAKIQREGRIIEEKGEVILTTKLFEDMLIHGLSFANSQMPQSQYKEVYGLAIGKIKGEDLILTEVVPMASGTDVEVEFREEHYGKAAMIDSMAAERNEFIVGWYHTHPGLGLFLSPTDIINQLGYQSLNPKAIAIVFDFTQQTPSTSGFTILRLDDPTLGQASYYHEVRWRIRDARKNLFADNVGFFQNFLIELNNVVLKNRQMSMGQLAQALNRSELVLNEIIPQLITMRYLPAVRLDPETNILSLK